MLILSASAAVFHALPAFAAEDMKAFAHEAFIYSYPMVKNYLTMYQYALEQGGSQYQGPINTLNSTARVYTPDDTGVITPNSDTPYSWIVMDVRAEPIVITMPPIEEGRYYSMQLIDLYTHNVDYLGTRVDGNGGGDYLITGPGWNGDVPSGIKRVIEMPTFLNMGLIRTQLFNAGDIEKVKEIQAGYRAQLLSSYAGRPAPTQPPTVWPAISDEAIISDFWSLTAFLLQFAPPLTGEDSLRGRFKELGIEPGKQWPPQSLPQDTSAMMQALVAPTEQEIRETSYTLTDSSKIFGTPEFMRGRYMDRAAAALGGIYGNTVEEALYVMYGADGAGNVLDGKANRYTLTFDKDSLPPVDAFWSITMYDRKTQFLVHNEIDRYLINSTMLPDLQVDENGKIVLFVQHDSPGEEHKANWLPAPEADFYAVMRLYLPNAAALNGSWSAPKIATVP